MIRPAQARTSGVAAPGPAELAELAEIHSAQRNPPTFKPRATLLPAEEALSLPPPQAPDPKLVLLGRLLGSRLTSDNPLWRGDAVPRLRALQKALIAHSLTLAAPERRPCLDALRVVEQGVQLRLRWQQMLRSDLEAALAAGPHPEEETHAVQAQS